MASALNWWGIERPDSRSEAIKAAANKIMVGASETGTYSFRCAECDQYAWLPHKIDHVSTCGTGRALGGKNG